MQEKKKKKPPKGTPSLLQCSNSQNKKGPKFLLPKAALCNISPAPHSFALGPPQTMEQRGSLLFLIPGGTQGLLAPTSDSPIRELGDFGLREAAHSSPLLCCPGEL